MAEPALSLPTSSVNSSSPPSPPTLSPHHLTSSSSSPPLDDLDDVPLTSPLPPPPAKPVLLTTEPPDASPLSAPASHDDPDSHSHSHSFPPLPSAAPLSSTHLTTAFLTTPSPFPPSTSTSSSSMHRTPSSSSTSGGGAPAGAKIWGVLCVAFDHALGPVVEFGYPKRLMNDDELMRNLPFLALPDGAHARDEDYSYFHLLLPSVSANTPQTIFGISCNRQISAEQLINKGKDVTRSTVQKAIVVLANKPIFGPLRDKLGVVTRSFFAQRDFDDKSILVDLYQSFEPAGAADSPTSSAASSVGGKGKEKERDKEGEEADEGEETDEDEAENEEGGMYMGTSLRELVYRFRFKTLMLLKLLMLQRRVMFFAASTPVEQLCTFQYSLVALIPALLTNLTDSASPSLSTRAQRIAKPTSLKTSDRRSLIRYLGLPLDVFGANSFFQPYLPLQQIDLLKTRSFLVGTTNSIFQQQRDCHIDVIVNIDSATLEILNPKLTPLVTLTAADRKWMDELVTLVDQSWNSSDPSRPLGQGFVGSDDFLRGKFEEYVCSLLACVKFGEFLGRERGERAEMLLSAPELESYNPSSFNEAFINAFKRTAAYELWDRNTDEAIFDLVEPKHPMEGKTNPIEDVGIRLVHGLHDLSGISGAHLNLSHLPDLSQLPANLSQLPANINLKPARERLSRGWSAGGEWFAGVQGALRERAAGAGATTPGSEKGDPLGLGRGSPSLGGSPKKENDAETSSVGSAPSSATGGAGTGANTPGAGATFLAGVDVAKTGAAQLASGFGNFLGRKSSFFTTRSEAPSASSSAAPSSVAPPTTSSASATPAPAPASTSGAPFGSFLRPLNTAAAATVPSSTATPPQTGGLGGFFGGIRRTLTPVTDQTGFSSTSSSSPVPMPSSSSSAAPRSPQPTTLSPSLLSSSPRKGKPLPTFPPSSSSPSLSASSPIIPLSVSPNPAEEDEELLAAAKEAGIAVRDLDKEFYLGGLRIDEEGDGGEEEGQEEMEREDERERARRKLEGGT
ncbi:hypothetical protein JCM8547_005889 [Rhodosporidiobolus lusitaniae]